MAYDKDFYKAYQEYLLEPTVREAHDYIFSIANLNSDFREVIDFGCGAFNEFYQHTHPIKYLGVDINLDENPKEIIAGRDFLSRDYRKERILRGKVSFTPTAFVSLFSTEITASWQDNYDFYKKIFSEFPSIHSGLVSGFFYTSKKNINPISENGGIVSYQTLESIDDVQQDSFNEKRIILSVPSKMFGQDVFEVWKFFSRNKEII